jgi:uncharacterized protein
LPEDLGRQAAGFVSTTHEPVHAPIPAAAGIGLRFPHHRAVLEDKPGVAWLEVHPENYMGGGTPVAYLDRVRHDYPVALHGVGLSLGSADGLDARHLARLARLIERVEPGLVSEHLAWSASGGRHFADLLPLPYTEEALAAVRWNVEVAQEALGRRILVENPSSYLRYRHSTIPEWEFLGELAERTGCGILCDVNNIFVSACNHRFDPHAYLRALPPEHIGEIHLAGHSVREFPDGRSIRIDDHGSRVGTEVWALYAEAITLFGRVPTLVEWDTDVPPLAVLLEEAARAACIMAGESTHACVA